MTLEFGAFSRSGDRFVLRLGAGERAVVSRLLGELRALLVQPDAASPGALDRLFPVVHPDDAELEAEYQHLMRDELVASRLAGINTVEQVLEADSDQPDRAEAPASFDEETLLAFMQAVNGVRLVLGTMLDVSEDDTVEDATGALAPEYHLYAFLSWLLDSAVVAMSPDVDD